MVVSIMGHTVSLCPSQTVFKLQPSSKMKNLPGGAYNHRSPNLKEINSELNKSPGAIIGKDSKESSLKTRTLSSSNMSCVTSDDFCAINELLEGRMDLNVDLPSECESSCIVINVERCTPMMDLLVSISNQNKLNAADYRIVVDGYNFKPSTPIGSLDVNRIKIVAKPIKTNLRHFASNENVASSYTDISYSPSSVPFQTTFRLQVNLPKNQLMVTRVTPNSSIAEIKMLVCNEKGLDYDNYQLVAPGERFLKILELKRSIAYYAINEVTLMSNKCIAQTQMEYNASSVDQVECEPKKAILSLLIATNQQVNQDKKLDTATISKPVIKKRPAPQPPNHNNNINNNNNLKSASPKHGSKSSNVIIKNVNESKSRVNKQNGSVSDGSNSGHVRQNSDSDSSGYHESLLSSDSPELAPLPKSVHSSHHHNNHLNTSHNNHYQRSKRTGDDKVCVNIKSKSVTELNKVVGVKKRKAPLPPDWKGRSENQESLECLSDVSVPLSSSSGSSNTKSTTSDYRTNTERNSSLSGAVTYNLSYSTEVVSDVARKELFRSQGNPSPDSGNVNDSLTIEEVENILQTADEDDKMLERVRHENEEGAEEEEEEEEGEGEEEEEEEEGEGEEEEEKEEERKEYEKNDLKKDNLNTILRIEETQNVNQDEVKTFNFEVNSESSKKENLETSVSSLSQNLNQCLEEMKMNDIIKEQALKEDGMNGFEIPAPIYPRSDGLGRNKINDLSRQSDDLEEDKEIEDLVIVELKDKSLVNSVTGLTAKFESMDNEEEEKKNMLDFGKNKKIESNLDDDKKVDKNEDDEKDNKTQEKANLILPVVSIKIENSCKELDNALKTTSNSDHSKLNCELNYKGDEATQTTAFIQSLNTLSQGLKKCDKIQVIESKVEAGSSKPIRSAEPSSVYVSSLTKTETTDGPKTAIKTDIIKPRIKLTNFTIGSYRNSDPPDLYSEELEGNQSSEAVGVNIKPCLVQSQEIKPVILNASFKTNDLTNTKIYEPCNDSSNAVKNTPKHLVSSPNVTIYTAQPCKVIDPCLEDISDYDNANNRNSSLPFSSSLPSSFLMLNSSIHKKEQNGVSLNQRCVSQIEINKDSTKVSICNSVVSSSSKSDLNLISPLLVSTLIKSAEAESKLHNKEEHLLKPSSFRKEKKIDSKPPPVPLFFKQHQAKPDCVRISIDSSNCSKSNTLISKISNCIIPPPPPPPPPPPTSLISPVVSSSFAITAGTIAEHLKRKEKGGLFRRILIKESDKIKSLNGSLNQKVVPKPLNPLESDVAYADQHKALLDEIRTHGGQRSLKKIGQLFDPND